METWDSLNATEQQLADNQELAKTDDPELAELAALDLLNSRNVLRTLLWDPLEPTATRPLALSLIHISPETGAGSRPGGRPDGCH